MIQSSLRVVLMAALVTAGAAQADTWRAVSATLGTDATFLEGNATFADGAFNNAADMVWLARWDDGLLRFSLAFNNLGISGTQAPNIDLANMRGDFSALFMRAYNDSGVSMIGRQIGLAGWVPITANADQTYSATWTLAPHPWAYSGYTFSLRFTSAVDEPSPVHLLALALPVVLLVAKRHRKAAP